MKLVFCGGSDDTFGEIESVNDTFDTCAKHWAVCYTVKNDDGALIVVGNYVGPGVWSVGIAPSDEDQPLPDWPVIWEVAGYTTVLTLFVPGNVEVRCLNRQEEE